MSLLVGLALLFQIGTPYANAKLARVKGNTKPALHRGFLAAIPAEGRPLLFDNGHKLYTLKPSVLQRNHARIRFHKMDREIALEFGPADIVSIRPTTMKTSQGSR